MIIFIIFFVSIGSVYSINSVFIYQSPQSNEYPVLKCTIYGVDANKFSPHLHCPLTKSRMCYTNCSKECKFSNGKCNALAGLEAIYGCKYTSFAADHIQIEFFIDSNSLQNNNGEWYCSYAGVNSKAITLSLTKRSIIITMKSVIPNTMINKDGRNMKNKGTPKNVQVIERTNLVEETTIPTISKEDQQTMQKIQNNEDISFKSFITKFQVVIGILCLFSISVLLNIIFCIRDSMIKQYIDNVKSNVRSHKTLLFCICQSDPIAKLEQMVSRESEYYKDDYNFNRNNIYEIDSQSPLMAQQRHYVNKLLSAPNVSRSKSFQNASPLVLPISLDSNYMSIPRAFSHYTPSNYELYGNHFYAPTGSISLTGSDTPQENIIREGYYQSNKEGKEILMNVLPNNVANNPQNIDLINDFDQTNISLSTSNLSKNEE